jgi:hypothetical protein
VRNNAAKTITGRLKRYNENKRYAESLKRFLTPEELLAVHKSRFAASLSIIRLRGMLYTWWLRRLQKKEFKTIRMSNIHLGRRREQCVRLIQRVYRGFKTRSVVTTLRQEYEKTQAALYRNVSPYYRLQDQYTHTQNLLYKKQIIKIQCAFRRHHAQKSYLHLRKCASARKILFYYRRYRDVVMAKQELHIRRVAFEAKVAKVIITQTQVRIWRSKLLVKRMKASDLLLCFCLHKMFVQSVFKAVKAQRKRLWVIEYRRKSIIKIQSLGRRYLTRIEFLKSYRKRVKARSNRLKANTLKARVKIQTLIRCFLAKVKVKKRRVEINREKQIREVNAALEAGIDVMHDNFLTELHAVKTQQVVRMHIAKK